MQYKFAVLLLVLIAAFFLSGCMTYKSYTRVDDLTQKIKKLEELGQEKLSQAKSGDLSISEALNFVKESNAAILEARNEVNDIRSKENVGWPELVGAVLASVFGATGFVRAWRGPSHKSLSTPV